MKISVYTCSYDGRESFTQLCLDSLDKQTLPPDEVILILDSNREQEHFSKLFKNKYSYPFIIAASGKKGVAAARNKGVSLTAGDIVATIDSDAYAHPDWLKELAQTLDTNPNAVMVGGPVLPVFHGKPIDQKFNWIIGCTSVDPPTNRPIGCNMAVRRDVINQIDGFDESLGRIRDKLAIGEETDFILRVMNFYGKQGVLYNKNAFVYHQTPAHRTSLSYIIRRSYEEGYTKLVIGRRYNLKLESAYLQYYLKHFDILSMIVLFAVGIGYVTAFIFARK